MRICYFGTYEKDYPRNRVIIQGLKKAGVEVTECHIPLWEKKKDKTKWSFFDKISLALKLPFIYIRLAINFRKLDRKNNFDCMIVGYIGQLDMLIAHLIAKKKKIIFNPMISLYDTLVNDRKIIKNSFLKKLLHWTDRKSCSYADLVVLDTEKHAGYFRKEFGIKNADVLYIGADEIFKPGKKEKKQQKPGKGRFRVLFYGKYTPLHGTESIIMTAKLLENNNDIEFEIIGKGQTYKKDMETAENLDVKNIEFREWVSYN